MKKIVKFVFFNLIILLILLTISEALIYNIYKYDFIKKFKSALGGPRFSYTFNHPEIFCINPDYFDGKNELMSGRLPDGLHYSGKPIIIFGCSYAHGQFLKASQTLSRKLSDILKVPVYNRAVPAQAYQTMYYQSENDFFYEQVPKSDIVLYVLINDQIRRTYLTSFDILGNYLLLHYDIKNGELIYHDYSNPLKNLFKTLYTYKYLTAQYYDYYLNNPKNAEKISDDLLLYFVKTKENLEKRWGNKIKFYILFYEDKDIKNAGLIRKKLENNGFIVISTKELTDKNLSDAAFVNGNYAHPSEKAWSLLAPIIAEILDEKK